MPARYQQFERRPERITIITVDVEMMRFHLSTKHGVARKRLELHL
jgi:hypothetical protein